MAKIKVHELAKELDTQSKDIISYLQDKGIEVKAAQSAVEDSAADLARKQFGVKASTKSTEEKIQVKAEQVIEDKMSQEDAPQKKKKIIFVSNPQNSKMPGGKPQNNQAQPRPNQGQSANQGVSQSRPQGGYNQQTKPAPVQPRTPIKPLTPPSPTPSVQMVSSRTQTAKPAVEEEVKVSAPAMERETPRQQERPVSQQPRQSYDRQNADGQRPYQDRNNAGSQGGQRPYQDRNNAGSQGGQRPYQDRNNAGSQGGQRPYQDRNNAGGNYARPYNNQNGENRGGYQGQGQSQGGPRRDGGNARPGFNNNQGGFRGGNNSQGGNRPFNNSERDSRGGQGAQDRFKKPGASKGFATETPIKDTEKHREEEKRRLSQEKDKRSKKDMIFETEDSLAAKPGRFIKPEKKKEEIIEEVIKVIVLPEVITIKELAEKMKLQPSAIVKKLFLQGQIVTVNQEISYEDAENIAMEYEILCEREVKVDVIEELLKEEDETEDELVSRPPVICVMGHVDHGKTSLLDAIRKTRVSDKEAGGITQHIGAYTVNLDGKKITFLDTPGHEAFTAMRMRGANSTDIAILVVAADDGVMPQTVEAINHAKAAGIEIVVAVNKVDKPGANIERVKQELTEYELVSADWGGNTEFVPVSAKTGEGIETLLETILLTSEILELKANPNRRARGLVIEAELDKGRGSVATVLVQKGTLHVGDFISAGACYGKVRAMIDDKGKQVKVAGPSTPVEILGLSDVPSAGEVFISHDNDKTAKTFAETYKAENKEKMLEETKSRMSLDDLFSQIQEGNLKELNLIVKADVQGSVEAVKQSLTRLSNEEVVVKCIHGGVGAINESDVMLATASKAIIIGFNIRPDVAAKATAEREGVDIRLYKVIYQAIEDIEAAM